MSQINHHRGVLNNFKLPSQDDVFFQDKHPDMFNVSLKPNLSAFTVLAMLTAAFVSCNQSELSESNEKPEDNRFTKVVLTQGFDEPMEMALTNDGRVLIVERKGALKVFDTKTNQVKTVTTVPVNTKYVSKEGVASEAEEGLMGIVVHPDFTNNHWIYMYDLMGTNDCLCRVPGGAHL